MCYACGMLRYMVAAIHACTCGLMQSMQNAAAATPPSMADYRTMEHSPRANTYMSADAARSTCSVNQIQQIGAGAAGHSDKV